MTDPKTSLVDRLCRVPPFTALTASDQGVLNDALVEATLAEGEILFEQGASLPGLYILETGAVDVFSVDPATGTETLVSHRGPGDVMGERGLMRGGVAMLTARAAAASGLLMLPTTQFFQLTDQVPEIAEWFGRARPSRADRGDGPYAVGLMAVQVSDLMARDVETCRAEASVRDVAEVMRDRRISSVLVMEGEGLLGIVTVHDLVNKVLAEGRGGDVPVAEVMTPDPITIAPGAVGLDALMLMAGRRINHLPVADGRGRIVGLIGRTDLFRQQNATASHMASEIVAADDAAGMASVMERLPDLLSHLSAAGVRPAAICRRITDLTDAVTRRLLALGEEKFGPPPVPYLWAACGSQGRREQTGVSDQDNCLILDDALSPADEAYFEALASFVSDGLNEVGFVYCPGDMMATNPRWRQPLRKWRGYFRDWIAEPDEEAQMLASVMFDLRPIAGQAELFSDLQTETLGRAKRNSIFVRHMIGNSLKHTPPLGFWGGLSVIRSGAHKNRVDLKLAGVVPIVDLGRVYALKGGITALNTRDRVKTAGETGVISEAGARDLLDAYDLIAETRLQHQAAQIAAGQRPDNFVDPARMSELDRNHLRDAFMVVKTMQSALGGLF